MHLRAVQVALAVTTALGLLGPGAQAQLVIDWESGPTLVSRSDIGVPGDGGTVYSAADDANVLFAQRLAVGSAIGGRHLVTLSFAPYELETDGQFTQTVVFQDSIFLPGETVRSLYELGLFRLSYHYQAVDTDRLDAAVGVAAQLRRTKAALTSGGLSVGERAWGFRPMASARLGWRFVPLARFRIDIDAIGGPGERWEDVLVGVELEPAERFRFRAGYRLLEGRLDADALYNAVLIHHFVVGMTLTI